MGEINVFEGYAGPTLMIDTDDTVDNLIDDGALPMLHATKGHLCRAVTITCELNDVRFAFGTDPAQDGSMGHVLASGASMRIANSKSIRSFRYISASAGNAGRLMVTPEYFTP